MTDNTIKSTDINPVDKTEKKPATKKAAPKKQSAKKSDAAPNGIKDGYKIIVFESGTAYNVGDYRFTQANKIQEIPEDLADMLLGIDNFRLPDQFEIEEYLNGKED